MKKPATHQNRKIILRAALGLMFALGWQADSFAQRLYRCGSVYQDHPCADDRQSKVINVYAGPASGSAVASDAGCAQRGADAKKLVWERESGITLEQALAREKNPARRKLIEDVYLERGSADNVRARIENSCMAEKERRERAGAPEESARRDASAGGNAGDQKPAPGKNADKRAEDEKKQAKAELCARMKRALDNNRSRQRAGGEVQDMEDLRQEQRDTEQEMRQAGCQ